MCECVFVCLCVRVCVSVSHVIWQALFDTDRTFWTFSDAHSYICPYELKCTFLSAPVARYNTSS